MVTLSFVKRNEPYSGLTWGVKNYLLGQRDLVEGVRTIRRLKGVAERFGAVRSSEHPIIGAALIGFSNMVSMSLWTLLPPRVEAYVSNMDVCKATPSGFA
jgi:hypothetical protein